MSTITVVIASYQYGHLAAHCIESVLCQSRKPDKILFVDDGVGDCNHLPKIYPEVEYVLREKNMGTVANFQDMLMRVTTDKCMFLGADNWLRADTLEILDKIDADVVIYDIVVTGDSKKGLFARHGKEMTPYQGDLYWPRDKKHHGSMMYKTKLAQSIGYQGTGGKHSEEDHYMFRQMVKRGAKMHWVKEGLLYYRRHRENFIKN
jgi:glycosyltransferase involved in cell wall biosynthesis